MGYKHIETIDELGEEFIIFKHSDSCPISAGAKAEVDEFVKENEVILIVVQEQRKLSDEIAKKYGIKHETPQVIIMNESGAIVLNHRRIKKEALEESIIN